MEITEAIKKCIDDLYSGRDHVELTIGVLKDGSIDTLHLNERKEETDEKLIYPVGSIGKPFTASLLAKLISKGRVDLEANLDKYIDDLPSGYYPTIKRLATHHSGYGGAPNTLLQTLVYLLNMNKPDGILHVNPFRGNLDEEVMLDTIKKMKLKDQDYKFSYSNFAYGVLGYIIGKLQGGDYFSAMEEYVSSLGLKDTSLQNSDMTGYDKKGNPCKPWQWERTDIIAPAGALLSSMEDLLRFAQIHFDGTEPYLDMCHRKYADGEKSFDQGLAWRLDKETGYSYHVGNAGAFSCILAMDRKSSTAVAIGLNYALVDIDKLAFGILKELED